MLGDEQIKFKSRFPHPQTIVVFLTCADDFLRLLFFHSYLSLQGNKLQQLPATLFSNLTSLRSRVVYVCNATVCTLRDTWTVQTHSNDIVNSYLMHDVVTEYLGTPLVKSDKHSARAVAI
jgi:hypothetical protein